eukprot:gene5911-5808_t
MSDIMLRTQPLSDTLLKTILPLPVWHPAEDPLFCLCGTLLKTLCLCGTLLKTLCLCGTLLKTLCLCGTLLRTLTYGLFLKACLFDDMPPGVALC